jgi:hypothetical protein
MNPEQEVAEILDFDTVSARASQDCQNVTRSVHLSILNRTSMSFGPVRFGPVTEIMREVPVDPDSISFRIGEVARLGDAVVGSTAGLPGILDSRQRLLA